MSPATGILEKGSLGVCTRVQESLHLQRRELSMVSRNRDVLGWVSELALSLGYSTPILHMIRGKSYPSPGWLSVTRRVAFTLNVVLTEYAGFLLGTL